METKSIKRARATGRLEAKVFMLLLAHDTQNECKGVEGITAEELRSAAENVNDAIVELRKAFEDLEALRP